VGGHTLDLVFSLGLDVDHIRCEDLLISDHTFIFFNLSVKTDPMCLKTSLRRSHIITQSTADQFAAHFCCDNNTNMIDLELLIQSFNQHCSTLLDIVAPLKDRTRAICNTSPWITDAVCCLRRKCRRTERPLGWKCIAFISKI